MNLFPTWFSSTSWDAWRVFLRVLFALPLSTKDHTTFENHTGRKTRLQPSREAWVISGRRSGKSLIAAFIAVFVACFKDYSTVLKDGERGVVMLIATDRKQARVIFRYISSLLEAVPMLSRMVVAKTKESIELSNSISIEVHTCSFKSIRGYTVVAAICDEIAYWTDEDSANPDSEVISALRPAMITIPDSLLLCISSPYSRRGALWNAYKENHGNDSSDVLVWQADSRSMNPTLDQKIIDKALLDDPAKASAEYLAQFRSDLESFVSQQAVDAVVSSGCFEVTPASSFQYVAFCDPAGGSGKDSFTLAIAHSTKDGTAVLDCIREQKPPFSPEKVTEEFSKVFESYNCQKVTGDRYAGEWPREQFRKHGIDYVISEKSKGEIYQAVLPLINSGKVELLDNPRLITQLCGLERRTRSGGKDIIDHAPNSHDDLINSAAGVLILAASPQIDFTTIPNGNQYGKRRFSASQEVRDYAGGQDDHYFGSKRRNIFSAIKNNY